MPPEQWDDIGDNFRIIILITIITHLCLSSAPLVDEPRPPWPCFPEVTKALYCSPCATIIIVTIIVTIFNLYYELH